MHAETVDARCSSIIRAQKVTKILKPLISKANTSLHMIPCARDLLYRFKSASRERERWVLPSMAR